MNKRFISRNTIIYILISLGMIVAAFTLDKSFNYFKSLEATTFNQIYGLINVLIGGISFGVLLPIHALSASKLKGKASKLVVSGFVILGAALTIIGYITINLTSYPSLIFLVSSFFVGIVELVNLLVQKKTDAI